ncbi:MAG: hypothetical protein U9R73_06590 [Pseudomonadota bacterium]|nr:hypothetical protein [Pseudomonadota bacterium]
MNMPTLEQLTRQNEQLLRDIARQFVVGAGGNRAEALRMVEVIRQHIWSGQLCTNPLCDDRACTGCVPY